MRIRLRLIVLLGCLTGVALSGQSLSSQVLALLARNNVWTGTNTYNGNVTINGTCTGCSGSGASITAPYVLSTATAGYTNAQALGALSTGIVKVTTTTG